MATFNQPAADYYALLEISQTSSVDEIKKSWRRLALLHHPDKNGGSEAATEKTKLINEAWETLKDTEKRRVYDLTYAPPRTYPTTSSWGYEWAAWAKQTSAASGGRTSTSQYWKEQEKKANVRNAAKKAAEQEWYKRQSDAQREAQRKAQRSAYLEKEYREWMRVQEIRINSVKRSIDALNTALHNASMWDQTDQYPQKCRLEELESQLEALKEEKQAKYEAEQARIKAEMDRRGHKFPPSPEKGTAHGSTSTSNGPSARRQKKEQARRSREPNPPSYDDYNQPPPQPQPQYQHASAYTPQPSSFCTHRGPDTSMFSPLAHGGIYPQCESCSKTAHIPYQCGGCQMIACYDCVITLTSTQMPWDQQPQDQGQKSEPQPEADDTKSRRRGYGPYRSTSPCTYQGFWTFTKRDAWTINDCACSVCHRISSIMYNCPGCGIETCGSCMKKLANERQPKPEPEPEPFQPLPAPACTHQGNWVWQNQSVYQQPSCEVCYGISLSRYRCPGCGIETCIPCMNTLQIEGKIEPEAPAPACTHEISKMSTWRSFNPGCQMECEECSSTTFVRHQCTACGMKACKDCKERSEGKWKPKSEPLQPESFQPEPLWSEPIATCTHHISKVSAWIPYMPGYQHNGLPKGYKLNCEVCSSIAFVPHQCTACGMKACATCKENSEFYHRKDDFGQNLWAARESAPSPSSPSPEFEPQPQPQASGAQAQAWAQFQSSNNPFQGQAGLFEKQAGHQFKPAHNSPPLFTPASCSHHGRTASPWKPLGPGQHTICEACNHDAGMPYRCSDCGMNACYPCKEKFEDQRAPPGRTRRNEAYAVRRAKPAAFESGPSASDGGSDPSAYRAACTHMRGGKKTWIPINGHFPPTHCDKCDQCHATLYKCSECMLQVCSGCLASKLEAGSGQEEHTNIHSDSNAEGFGVADSGQPAQNRRTTTHPFSAPGPIPNLPPSQPPSCNTRTPPTPHIWKLCIGPDRTCTTCPTGRALHQCDDCGTKQCYYCRGSEQQTHPPEPVTNPTERWTCPHKWKLCLGNNPACHTCPMGIALYGCGECGTKQCFYCREKENGQNGQNGGNE